MIKSRLSVVQGLVIGHRIYRDTDRLITLFTRERGKVVALARGIRTFSSRRAGHLDLLTQLQADLYMGSRFETITGASCRNMFGELRGNLSKLSAGFMIAELLNRLLPEKQEQVEVYDLTIAVLNSLQSTPETEIGVRVGVYAQMVLEHLGFHPEARRINLQTPRSFVPIVEGLIERRLQSPKLLFAVI